MPPTAATAGDKLLDEHIAFVLKLGRDEPGTMEGEEPRRIAYVSIRQHTSAYVSIRQHTSAYVSIRQHT
jgi:hypothetical protein